MDIFNGFLDFTNLEYVKPCSSQGAASYLYDNTDTWLIYENHWVACKGELSSVIDRLITVSASEKMVNRYKK